MAQASPARIEAHIQGDVTGQVAIGQNILQIGAVTGGVVYVAAPGERPEIRPRPAPVLMLPRAFPDLLDRHVETGEADAGIDAGQVVEAFAPAGLGKTAFLRHLAHHRAVDAFPDGIVYLSARRRPLEDVYQALFDAFHESVGIPYRASETEVRHALAGRRALVLLDDLALEREELQSFVDALPGLTFVLGTAERSLWTEACAIGLEGLPPDDALALLERTIGRALGADEAPAGARLARVLAGRPLDVIQAGARVRAEGVALAELAERLATPADAQALVRERVAERPEPQRRILALLAAVAGVALASEEVEALADVPGAADALSALADAALVEPGGAFVQPGGTMVQPGGGGFALAEGLAEAAGEALDIAAGVERAVAHLRGAGALPPVDAVLALLDHAVQSRRWHDAIALARAVEPDLVMSLRWGAWRSVLDLAVEAARAVGDRAAEAWALHQLGTRAQCLGDLARAEPLLRAAAELREAVGEADAAAASRANLDAPRADVSPRPPRSPWVTGTLIVVGVTVAVLVASIAAREWIERWIDGQVGAPPAGMVQVTPSRVDFGDTGLPAREGLMRALRIVNRSDASVSVESATLDGDDAFRIAENGCGGALPAGGTCDVAVAFEPRAVGRYGARLVLRTTSATHAEVSAALSGAAVAPTLTARPARLAFEPVVAGREAERAVEVRNDGPGAARIDALDVEADPGFTLAGGSCVAGASLAAGAACSVRVRFAPAAEGPAAGALVLAGAFAGSPLRVALEGGASPPVQAAPAALDVEPARIDFGATQVGAGSGARRITVSNTGAVEAPVDIVLDGPDAAVFPLSDGCAGRVLRAGDRCGLEVGFVPLAAREYAATLRIALAGTPARRAVDLAGLGRPPAAAPGDAGAGARVDPEAIDFGAVRVGQVSDARRAALENRGPGRLTVRRVYVDGEDSAQFRVTGNGCSRRTLAAGARCLVDLAFTPRAAGARSGVLVIQEDGGLVHRVALAGTGERVAAEPDPAPTPTLPPPRVPTTPPPATGVPLPTLPPMDPGADGRGSVPPRQPGSPSVPLPELPPALERTPTPTRPETPPVVVPRVPQAPVPQAPVPQAPTTPRVPDPPAGQSDVPVLRLPRAPVLQTAPIGTRVSPPGKPDLIVARLTAGEPKADTQGNFLVPVQVTVENRGATAGAFAVALYHDARAQIAFVVSGQPDRWRPTIGTLAAGASTTVRGTAVFPSSLAGRTVRLDAEADSCMGVEFAERYCRVDEADEGNNVSATSARVTLPAFQLIVPKTLQLEPKSSGGIVDRLRVIQ